MAPKSFAERPIPHCPHASRSCDVARVVRAVDPLPLSGTVPTRPGLDLYPRYVRWSSDVGSMNRGWRSRCRHVRRLLYLARHGCRAHAESIFSNAYSPLTTPSVVPYPPARLHAPPRGCDLQHETNSRSSCRPRPGAVRGSAAAEKAVRISRHQRKMGKGY